MCEECSVLNADPAAYAARKEYERRRDEVLSDAWWAKERERREILDRYSTSRIYPTQGVRERHNPW